MQPDRQPRSQSSTRRIDKLLAYLFVTLGAMASPSVSAKCPGPVSVQVLGSGGPIANNTRASSGYLLWVNSKARLLVDAGGGTFARFGTAEARIEDLEAIVLTHLHADHAVELPAYLKSAWFGERTQALPLIGPSGNLEFPGLTEFVQQLIGPGQGAFRYLSGYMAGTSGYFKTTLYESDADSREPETILTTPNLTLTTIGVTHGSVPALGLLVEVDGKRIAFSGDQNGDNPQFGKMIAEADLLVMDHAVAQDAEKSEAELHARPEEIGRLAAEAKVKHLLLSHIMPRSEAQLSESQAIIKDAYRGKVTVAEDLLCVALPQKNR